MGCSNCGTPLSEDSKFCSQCGTPTTRTSGNFFATGGGDIGGSVYQAGRDVYVTTEPRADNSASYRAVPVWRSPVTQGVLSWAGLIVGLISVFPLYKLVEPAVTALSRRSIDGMSAPSPWWVAVWGIGMAILIAILGLREVARNETRNPILPGWALSGSGHRLSVERVKADPCPKCHGKMRYVNRPIETETIYRADGSSKTRVTRRAPALVCVRNSNHAFEVDPAEEMPASSLPPIPKMA